MADSLMIGAIPAATDPIHAVSSEPIAHLTLLFFGPAKNADVDAIRAAVAEVAQQFKSVTAKVVRRDTLGDDKADVLILDPGALRDVRSRLLANSAVRAAFNAFDQYPQWAPHSTLGYPDTPAAGVPGDTVTFDRLALWDDDYEGDEFPLGEQAPVTAAIVRTPAGAKKYGQPIGSVIVRDVVPQVRVPKARVSTVPPPSKGHRPTSAELAAAVRAVKKSPVPRSWPGGSADDDTKTVVYLDAAGYNERPTVLSTDEFDAYKGKTLVDFNHNSRPEKLDEFWRGTEVPKSGTDPYVNLTTAKPEEFFVGSGIYANGTHIGTKTTAKMFVSETPRTNKSERFPGGGTLVRIKIHPDARVVQMTDIPNYDRMTPYEIVKWAVDHNYDIVGLYGTRDPVAGIAVLNRSVMVVEELKAALTAKPTFAVGSTIEWSGSGKTVQGEVLKDLGDVLLVRPPWGSPPIRLNPRRLKSVTGGAGNENSGRVASASPVGEPGLDVSARSADDPGLGASAAGLPGSGREDLPEDLGTPDRAHRRRPVIAAGDSWHWQLRDQNGQWVKMGGKVKWFSMGLTHYGVVTGSPSPDVASVREDTGGREYHVPSVGLARQEDRLTLPGETPKPPAKSVTPDYQVKYPRGTNEGQIVATVSGEADPVGVLRWDYTADPPVVIDVSVDERYRRRGIASAMFRLAKKNESRLQHSDVLTDDGRAFAGGVTAAGDSWRWQLRDRNGKWIEMGSEVRYLVRGLYRQGIVIGSPSPGMASVHEHITELVRTIPSSRLEVVKSAADVVERTFKAGKVKTDLTDNPALVDLVERAQKGDVSLDDWGEWLIPDEFKSLREHVVTALPNVYALYEMTDPTAPYTELSESTAAVVWDWIREPATSLGFNEDTGPIFARGIVIRVMQRMERERLWRDALIKRESVTRDLAPKVNDVRKTGQVAIAAHELDAENILVDGRFMTQFDIGSSGGYYGPELRAAAETSMFGTHPDIDVSKRTIYGYVFTPGHENAPGVEQYGEVRFILKPGVRTRTTMSVGDTLGTGAVPVPMTGPDVNAKDAYMSASGVGGGSPAQSLIDEGEDYVQKYDYFEAQVHDGVTTGDIAEIVITDWVRKSDYDDLVKLAEGLGIKVRFV